MGRQHQGMSSPGVRQVPEGSGEHGKMEESACEIVCGAPTTLAVKGLMMMMMKVIIVSRCLVACAHKVNDYYKFHQKLTEQRV